MYIYFQGKITEVEQHQEICLLRHFVDQPCPVAGLAGCPVAGCPVGKQKTLEKKKVRKRIRLVRTGMSFPPLSTTTSTSTQRRHCDHCDRDFSRKYFNRHVCRQSAHPVQNMG